MSVAGLSTAGDVGVPAKFCLPVGGVFALDVPAWDVVDGVPGYLVALDKVCWQVGLFCQMVEQGLPWHALGGVGCQGEDGVPDVGCHRWDGVALPCCHGVLWCGLFLMHFIIEGAFFKNCVVDVSIGGTLNEKNSPQICVFEVWFKVI